MTSTGVKIRRATASDSESVYRLLDALGYSELDPNAFAETFAAVLRHPEMIVLVAESDNAEVVGFAGLSHRPQLRLTGKLLTIDELSVSKEARGRGVGRALLAEIKLIAGDLAVRRLQLETRRSRESYRRGFYVANGFEEADSAIMRLKQ